MKINVKNWYLSLDNDDVRNLSAVEAFTKLLKLKPYSDHTFSSCGYEEGDLWLIGENGKISVITEHDYNRNYDYKVFSLPSQWLEAYEYIRKPMPIINGYDGRLDEKGMVIYGCASFHIQHLKSIVDNNELDFGNRKIKSITFDSDVKMTIEEIEAIVANYKNKGGI